MCRGDRAAHRLSDAAPVLVPHTEAYLVRARARARLRAGVRVRVRVGVRVGVRVRVRY